VLFRSAGTGNPYRLAYEAFRLPGVAADAGGKFPELQPIHDQDLSDAEIKQRRDRLLARVDEYWQALVASDYPRAFALMDPLFRGVSNLMAFGAPLNKLQYSNYQVLADSVAITGNRAVATAQVTTEAATFMVMGTRTSIPKREQALPEQWVWVDGDWFRVYEYQGTNHLPL
jgi:hypothetical protein